MSVRAAERSHGSHQVLHDFAEFGRTARELREAAAGETNLMYPIIAAARADVTMGEMCDALRDVWGIWRETPVF